MRFLFLSIAIFILGLSGGQAQLQAPPSWQVSAAPNQAKLGDVVTLTISAQIPTNWYMYSSDFDPDLGPTVTTFDFAEHPSYQLVGSVKAIKPKKKYDDLWEGEYTYFIGTATFIQQVKLLATDPVIKIIADYQVCSDVSGQCIPYETDLPQPVIKVNAVSGTKPIIEAPKEGKKTVQEKPVKSEPKEKVKLSNEQAAAKTAEEVEVSQAKENASTENIEENETSEDNSLNTEEPDSDIMGMQVTGEQDGVPVVKYSSFNNPYGIADSNESKGLWALFIIAFGAGLVALLTPCIYPMIPLTVTYFLKMGEKNKSSGLGYAIFYGLCIIGIYVLLGLVFAKVFGADYANELSTHWLPNLIFSVVFIVFALSFFGLFEITLPNSFINKVDKQADRGGLIGIFFMAFALVLIGFSCTGPIVGSILIETMDGIGMKSIVSMLGFSMAFALPFTIFAIFPGWLNSLPKSGGWLNSVKVVLGFLELALALKFFSVADQAYHWGLLDREVYIAFWIVIFAMLGFYLLGKLRLPHDNKVESVSVGRLILAVITFGFVLYLIPGLVGAPLKSLAGYLPPMSTHDFNVISLLDDEESELPAVCEEPKYDDFLHLPHGLSGYFSYEQALACARAEGKPLFIDFTGHGCVNCREMEENVWRDPAVLKRLREDYVVVALYVDEKQELPEDQWYVSAYDERLKKSIGKQNLDFMIQRLNANAQPYYTLVDPFTENLLSTPQAYDLDVQNFVQFLDNGKKRYTTDEKLAVAK